MSGAHRPLAGGGSHAVNHRGSRLARVHELFAVGSAFDNAAKLMPLALPATGRGFPGVFSELGSDPLDRLPPHPGCVWRPASS